MLKRLAIAVLMIGSLGSAFCEDWRAAFHPSDFCKWCDSCSFYGSWLYWRAGGDACDYAVHKVRNAWIANETTLRVHDDETIHNIRFDWESGFRLGFHADLSCLWNWDVNWTHYHSSSSQSKEWDGTIAPMVTTLISMPVVYDFGTELDPMQTAGIKARLDLRYNTIDFEFGKQVLCSSCVTIRPHAGIRIADVRENLHDQMIFKRNSFETFSGTEAVLAAFFTQNRFKGAGVRAGLDFDFCICNGWNLIGRSAVSYIWGKTRLSHFFRYHTATVLDFYESEIDESYRQSRAMTDLLLGIRYSGLACDCYHFSIEIAWEHHCLFNQQRYWIDNSYFTPNPSANPPLLTTSSSKKRGDLALQGVSITASVAF
jgi:hypothetical protein